uniref:Solute carrier organic anion transporter family member n=1 Tax=Glossina pallidipes TaxID=7398 RepID=A0A1A9ZK73_GLOPL
MPAAMLQQPPGHQLCGLANCHPQWMQRFANTKTFMAVYSLLGTTQAMAYMYFVVTLTTIEKRFKIPSQTTGIILSGNEISQILLSLILSYIGGQRNRPRWIAWGIVFSGLSCYILALPHFIYGAGEDALKLTKEYYGDMEEDNINMTMSLVNYTLKNSQQLCGSTKSNQECETLLSFVPLVLIFLSQFVLGIGNTLYYALGQTYLDDNTKKTNTPLMLALAMCLRMSGPIVGFFFGYISLNMFIDPTKTPLIDNKDPRWLGAWWFGWMILGTMMILFSGLIGLFPKELPKKVNTKATNSEIPRVLLNDHTTDDDLGLPLGSAFSSNTTLDVLPAATTDLPKLKDFPAALMRLLRNKLLIYNIISAICYILGAAGYFTFLTKYMEVQFHKSAQGSTIVVGPASVVGSVVGLVASGLVISKRKPCASKVLFWNVIVGCVYILGQISYMFLYCNDSVILDKHGKLNLTSTCNANCSCEDVAYAPICHEPSERAYFSPCHAGCRSWNSEHKHYSNCSCLSADLITESHKQFSGNNITSTSPTLGSYSTAVTGLFSTDIPLKNDLISEKSTSGISLSTIKLKPGVCLQGCNTAFWAFSICTLIVNWFGSSGRIGNILVNYRAVSPKDKSFAQGLSLMMISLFALIPGPIVYGRIIDSTCLVWTKTCTGTGNCQLYDQTTFRYAVNLLAIALTIIGVIFDFLVWSNGRHLNLYSDQEVQNGRKMQNKDQPITPLLARK